MLKCPKHDRVLRREWIPTFGVGAVGFYVLRCPECGYVRPDKYGPKNYKRGNKEQTRAQMPHARVSRNKKR